MLYPKLTHRVPHRKANNPISISTIEISYGTTRRNIPKQRIRSYFDLTELVDVDRVLGSPLDELIDPIEADVEGTKYDSFGESQLFVGQQSVR